MPRNGSRGRSPRNDRSQQSGGPNNGTPLNRRDNQNNQTNQTNPGNQTNQTNQRGPPVCKECQQTGHKAWNCPNKMQNNSGSSQPRPTCNICNRVGHATDQCRSNPANMQNNNGAANNGRPNGNANANQHQHQNKGPKINGYTTDGFLFKDRDPFCTATENYCPICNSTDHCKTACPNQAGALNLNFSNQACRKCCIRGHTADECQNPQQQFCATCNQSGHKAAECRDKARGKLHEYLKIEQEKSQQSRFLWDNRAQLQIQAGPGQLERFELRRDIHNANGDILMDDIWTKAQEVAAKEEIKWPGQEDQTLFISLSSPEVRAAYRQVAVSKVRTLPKYVPAAPSAPVVVQKAQSSTAQPSNANALIPISNCSREQQEALTQLYYLQQQSQITARNMQYANKIDRSKQLYHKENWNVILRNNQESIPLNTSLTTTLLTTIILSMGKGANYWRDPYVMEALHKHEIPRCCDCQHEARIVDMNFDVLPAIVDILNVTDERNWGVFLAFGCECKAAKQGQYNWVPRLDVEMQGAAN